MNGPRIGTSELIDLLLSLIVLTIAFSARSGFTTEVLAVSAIGVGTGFLLHELAHKFVAQRYGYWAEYKMSPMGLILTIVMAFFIGIVFAAPGAVMIRKGYSSTPAADYSPDSDAYWDHLEHKAGGEEVWIALAGPLTNIILAAFFFSITMSGLVTNNFLLSVASYAFYINMSLAAFNLIPIDPFDGGKIFRGSAIIWTIVAVPTILFTLFILSRYLGMF